MKISGPSDGVDKAGWVKQDERSKQKYLAKVNAQEYVPPSPNFDVPTASTSTNLVTCPKLLCKSDQITADKQGYSLLKGAAGYVLTGGIPVSLLAGFIGSRKIQLTCLRCGHKWHP
jgi:tellurium resistance protein TerD